MAVLGPTAAGKSEAALDLAERLGGEIVSVDSMQVYRGMDIGTAKPGPDERRRVPHHLIDLVDPSEDFSVASFQEAGRTALASIAERGRTAVVAGGSGLHFRALVDPMEFPPTDAGVRRHYTALGADEARRRLEAADPDAGRWVDLANPRRVARALEILHLTGLTPSARAARPSARDFRAYRPLVDFVAVGMDPEGLLEERVVARFDRMLAAGLLDEVAALAGRLGRTAGQAVGYKELMAVADGSLGLAEGRDAAIRATLETARRQRTYFRRDPRITWVPWDEVPAARLARVAARVERKAATWTS